MSSIRNVLFKVVLAKVLVAAGVYAYVKYVLKDEITSDFSFNDLTGEAMSEPEKETVTPVKEEEVVAKPVAKKAVRKTVKKDVVAKSDVKKPARKATVKKDAA